MAVHRINAGCWFIRKPLLGILLKINDDIDFPIKLIIIQINQSPRQKAALLLWVLRFQLQNCVRFTVYKIYIMAKRCIKCHLKAWTLLIIVT